VRRGNIAHTQGVLCPPAPPRHPPTPAWRRFPLMPFDPLDSTLQRTNVAPGEPFWPSMFFGDVQHFECVVCYIFLSGQFAPQRVSDCAGWSLGHETRPQCSARPAVWCRPSMTGGRCHQKMHVTFAGRQHMPGAADDVDGVFPCGGRLADVHRHHLQGAQLSQRLPGNLIGR
jgi:hypothetical protein